MGKRSKVWLFFVAKKDGAVCNQCDSFISAKGGNTSNLIKHLTSHEIYLTNKEHIFRPSPVPVPDQAQGPIAQVSSVVTICDFKRYIFKKYNLQVDFLHNLQVDFLHNLQVDFTTI